MYKIYYEEAMFSLCKILITLIFNESKAEI